MIWRERPSASPSEIDAEQELELRLSAQARAGAEWALSALVARYQPPVVRYLVRLTGNKQTGYALAEQVFVRMGRRLRGPQGGRHLRLWLLRAATEAGLDAIRPVATKRRGRLLPGPHPAGLLPAVASEPRVSRLLTSLGVKAPFRPAQQDAPTTQEFVWQMEATSDEAPDAGHAESGITPEQVRQRVIRAVLGELPYADAQCLALHLVAGLNQSDVAQALGLADVVVRRRIVEGLEFFAVRYEATMERLGLSESSDAPAEDAPTFSDLVAGVDEPDVVDAPPVRAAADPAGPSEAIAAPVEEERQLPAPATSEVETSEPAEIVAPEAVAEPQMAAEAHQLKPDSTVAASESEPEPEMGLVSELESAPEPILAEAVIEPDIEAQATEPEAVTVDSPEVAPVASAEQVQSDDMPLPPRRAAITWRIVDIERSMQSEPALVSALVGGVSGPLEDTRAETSVGHVQTEAILEESEAETLAISDAVALAAPVLVVTAAPVTRPLPAFDSQEPTSDSSNPDGAFGTFAAVTIEGERRHVDDEAADEAHEVVVAARSRGRRRSTRTRHVLSADGEAEDPGDDALWPVG
jgi:DNA-directed RNA polymerase specialized sigma24 family protein